MLYTTFESRDIIYSTAYTLTPCSNEVLQGQISRLASMFFVLKVFYIVRKNFISFSFYFLIFSVFIYVYIC